MNDSHIWCERTEELRDHVAAIGAGPVALDTEADSLHHFPEKVCLVQLSFGDRDLLVDPLAGVDLGLLQPVLGAADVRCVLHGADYDLRVIDRDLGLRLAGLFDTMIASRLCGERQFGLAALLANYFDVTLDKRFQRADWSRRPLTPEMERYAVLDTRYLIELSERLEQQLRQLDRWSWAVEEFEMLERVRWVEPDDREAYRSVRGSSTLNPRGLAVLRELYGLRDRLAREADRPPFRLFHNDVLLTIAELRPRNPQTLLKIVGGRRTAPPRRRIDAVLDAVATAEALDETGLPEPRASDGRRMPQRKSPRLRRLLEKRNELADRLGLEHSVIGSRAVVERALERVTSGADPERTPGLRRWQWELLGDDIRASAG